MHDAPSVLLVDDDESLIAVLAELLNFRGFTISTAKNGVQGYTAYLRKQTEFVVTDIQMPELNGLEMMRCIRAINPAVRAIYMSANCDRFAAELQTEERQFSAMLLRKPFSSSQLLKLISSNQHPRAKRSERGVRSKPLC